MTLWRAAGPAVPLLLILLVACGPSGPKRYDAEGVVREVQPQSHQVVIQHEDIPGLMPAMTMNFDVPDGKLLATLAPGQRIAFRLEFDGRSYRVTSAQVVATGVAGTGAAPSLAGAVAERDVAPDFHLTDQDGHPLALGDLRGRTVVLDFVFTHCPGPCPVLTGIQRDVQKSLAPEVRARTHFVSITLDPERDTPEVLRAYALKRGADLSDWSFLTGAPDAVNAVIQAYGVAVIRRAGEEPAHLVATFVIDPEGRIARRFIGLDQGADERAQAVAEVAAGAAPPG